jgi:hypothetical protein
MTRAAYHAEWMRRKRAGRPTSRVAELEALLAEQQWQPIETAPRNGRDVLLYLAGPKRLFVGCWDADYSEWTIANFVAFPTHWRPLPAPPAMEVSDE